MVDLIVLTSLLQLIFILKILFNFFYKLIYLNEEVNCTEPSTSIQCSMLYVFVTGSYCHLVLLPLLIFFQIYQHLQKIYSYKSASLDSSCAQDAVFLLYFVHFKEGIVLALNFYLYCYLVLPLQVFFSLANNCQSYQSNLLARCQPIHQVKPSESGLYCCEMSILFNP